MNALVQRANQSSQPAEEEIAMGEKKKRALRVEFDRELKLEFHGANVTSDAGLLLYRELDEAWGLIELAEDVPHETRTGMNTRHTRSARLRQAVYGRLAGYEDTNDADRLRIDPAMRRVVGDRAKDHPAASTSQDGTLRDPDVGQRRQYGCSDRSERRMDRSSESPSRGEGTDFGHG